jgi:C1A family cysteine protease
MKLQANWYFGSEALDADSSVQVGSSWLLVGLVGLTRLVLMQQPAPFEAPMKGCLASGYPFVFGFTVYDSFESQQVANTGIVPMPASGESVVGGHAVMAVGYDDSQHRFIVRNSWGSGWGMQGYFTIPYAYLTEANLSSDFWTIRLVQV